jgi:sortase A
VTVKITQESLQSLGQALMWAQRALLVSAVVFLAYCALAYFDAWVYQARQNRALDQQPIVEHREDIAMPGASHRTSSPASVVPANGGLLGRIEIARVGLSVVVAEGVGSKTLRRAAGHIPGTALPGHDGNVGIAGHRDTFFRPLEKVRVNDVVVLTAHGIEYRYRVVFSQVVSPEDVAVLDPTGHEVLTLVTCHPFYFIGPAPNRFIVRAARV